MVSTVSLFGFAFFLAKRFHLQFGQALCTAACAVVALLFLAGVGNFLWLGAWSLVIGGLALGLVALARPHQSPDGLIVPLLAAALAVGLFLISRPAGYFRWDEFSHWGVIIKHLAEVHSLYEGRALLFPDYPPGLALFAYFITIPSGLTEPDAVYACGLFLLCLTSVLTAYRPALEATAALALAYLLSFALGTGPATVLIDFPLGAAFGAMVCIYLSESGKTTAKGVALAILPAVALVTLKAAGMSLAAIAIVVIGVDALLAHRKERRVSALLLAALAAAATGAYLLWKMVVSVGGYLNRTADFDLSYPIGVILETNASAVDQEIWANFVNAMMGSVTFYHIGAGLPLIAGILLAFLIVGTVFADGHTRWSRALIVGAMGVGAAFYSYGLLATYLTNMTDYEAVRLASFDRYLEVYLVGFSMVGVAFLASVKPRDVGLFGLMVALVMLTATVPRDAFDLITKGATSSNLARADLQQRMAKVTPLIEAGSKVYIIWDGSNGYEYFLAKFELMPNLVNGACWSISATPSDDIYRCTLSPDEFSRALAGYDYLYVASAPEAFFTEYADLFSPGEPTSSLFKVSDQKRPMLEPIL